MVSFHKGFLQRTIQEDGCVHSLPGFVNTASGVVIGPSPALFAATTPIRYLVLALNPSIVTCLPFDRYMLYVTFNVCEAPVLL